MWLLVERGEGRRGETAALGGWDLLVVYARSLLNVVDALEGSRMLYGVLECIRTLLSLGILASSRAFHPGLHVVGVVDGNDVLTLEDSRTLHVLGDSVFVACTGKAHSMKRKVLGIFRLRRWQISDA